jgi:hypothetical protein
MGGGVARTVRADLTQRVRLNPKIKARVFIARESLGAKVDKNPPIGKFP